MSLTSKQRAHLRSLGQDEEPVVFVGKAGVTPALFKEVLDALQARELIKCRVLPNAPRPPREIAEEVAKESRAELVGMVGRNFLLFLRSVKKPRIELLT